VACCNTANDQPYNDSNLVTARNCCWGLLHTLAMAVLVKMPTTHLFLLIGLLLHPDQVISGQLKEVIRGVHIHGPAF
jgi:hypothetical protein